MVELSRREQPSWKPGLAKLGSKEINTASWKDEDSYYAIAVYFVNLPHLITYKAD